MKHEQYCSNCYSEAIATVKQLLQCSNCYSCGALQSGSTVALTTLPEQVEGVGKGALERARRYLSWIAKLNSQQYICASELIPYVLLTATFNAVEAESG